MSDVQTVVTPKRRGRPPKIQPKPEVSEQPAETAPAPRQTQPTRRERNRVLTQSMFGSHGQDFDRLTATLPADWDFKEVYKPTFWINMAERLKENKLTSRRDHTGSIIELHSEDHTIYAELYVRAILERGLVVVCTGPQIDPKTGKSCPVDLETGLPWTGKRALESKSHTAKWNSVKRGWDIVRKEDLQIVADGKNLPTRELAEEWMRKTEATG